MRVDARGAGRTYHSDNLSGGGVFLLSDDPLPEETRVDLNLYLPRLDKPVPARGEVVWRQRQAPRGFAVKFTEISNLGRHLIKLHLWPAAARKF